MTVGERHPLELRRAPQNKLFTQTAHVHHHRRDVKEDLQCEISVTDGIEAVECRRIEAKLFRSDLTVDRMWCPRQCGTADR